MCFIVFAYRTHPRYPLVMATNRDEFYGRPTASAAFWKEHPDVLAGRDLKAGGTWMGVTRQGRIAALTNVREPGNIRPDAPSRGALVSDFLTGDAAPHAYLAALRPTADRYNGFNLLVGDLDELCYFSNRQPEIRRLGPGVYGLSNHLLDTPWPKVERGKARLARLLGADDLAPESLLALLADDAIAPDAELPETGVGLAWERVLSSIFIRSPDYGTRASTLVRLDADARLTFVERTHRPDAAPETQAFSFEIEPAPVEEQRMGDR